MKQQHSTLNFLEQFYDQNREEILQDFFTYLKFRSVSSEKEHKKDMIDCIDWLKSYLTEIGLEVDIWEGDGHPTLFAYDLSAGEEKPTLLIYNHYDVQPVDPIEEWDSPPFEPTIRDGEIYARGALDDKGQSFYVLQALRALKEKHGKLPINIKLLIEGEEEMGSVALSKLIPQKKKKLQADYLAIVDTGIRAINKPSVTIGARGICTMTVEVKGSKGDLHSGSHGGMVYNPLHALVSILAKLRDEKGKITVPGFYDDVVELTEEERGGVSWDFDEEKYREKIGALPTGGEIDYSPLESVSIRPTLEINGINGGYSGEGFKTVIPAKAIAKISARLVPNQDHEKVAEKIKDTLYKLAPKGVNLTVTINKGGGPGIRTSPHSKVCKAFAKAYEAVCGSSCGFTFEGGSIPIAAELSEASGTEIAFIGFGLDGDNIHAPNEHFGVERLKLGYLMIARGIELLGER